MSELQPASQPEIVGVEAPYVLGIETFTGHRNRLDEPLPAESWLIDSAANTIRRVVLKDPSPVPGKPVGVFEMPLEAGEAADILKTLRATGLDAVGASSNHEPFGMATIHVKFRQRGRKYIAVFCPAHDPDVMTAAMPLIDLMQKWGGRIYDHALAAFKLSVEGVTKMEGIHFRLVFENPGKQSISIRNPGALPPGDPEIWCGVTVAEWQDPAKQATEQIWKRIGIAPLQEQPADLVIEPGKSFSINTVEWPEAKSGFKYVFRAQYFDRFGPLQLPNGPMAIPGIAESAVQTLTAE